MKSPRKRYHIVLPDAPPPRMSGAGYFALLIVVVNIVACLIAERAMVVAATEESRAHRAASATQSGRSDAAPPTHELTPIPPPSGVASFLAALVKGTGGMDPTTRVRPRPSD